MQRDAARQRVNALRQKAAARAKENVQRRAAVRKEPAQSRSAQNVPSALSVQIVRQAKAQSKLNKKDIAPAISFFNP